MLASLKFLFYAVGVLASIVTLYRECWTVLGFALLLVSLLCRVLLGSLTAIVIVFVIVYPSMYIFETLAHLFRVSSGPSPAWFILVPASLLCYFVSWQLLKAILNVRGWYDRLDDVLGDSFETVAVGIDRLQDRAMRCLNHGGARVRG